MYSSEQIDVVRYFRRQTVKAVLGRSSWGSWRVCCTLAAPQSCLSCAGTHSCAVPLWSPEQAQGSLKSLVAFYIPGM